jgi:hypothetical protein
MMRSAEYAENYPAGMNRLALVGNAAHHELTSDFRRIICISWCCDANHHASRVQCGMLYMSMAMRGPHALGR